MAEAKVSQVGSVSFQKMKNSPRETIYKDIVRGLYEGRYAPGQRLIESQLTATYGVSRGPVREAMNRLAAAGVVVLELQRGACISALTIDEAIDVLVIAEGLMCIAARHAAKNVRYKGAGERLSKALDDVLAFDASKAPADPEHANARDLFFAELTTLSENSQLGRLMPTVQIHLLRIQFASVIRGSNLWRHKDYIKIAEAVFNGDEQRAEAGVRDHFSRSIRAFSEYRDNRA